MYVLGRTWRLIATEVGWMYYLVSLLVIDDAGIGCTLAYITCLWYESNSWSNSYYGTERRNTSFTLTGQMIMISVANTISIQ